MVGPAQRDEQIARRELRVSIDTPVAAQPAGPAPPVARTASAAVHSGVISSGPLEIVRTAFGDLAGDLGIVEGKVLSPMIWPVSWPLPAMTSRSPGREFGDRGCDRAAPIADFDRPGDGGQDRAPDRGGIFAARVVVGHVDAVGAGRGGASPISGRLPGSRSPPQPNNDDEPARRMRAQSGQHSRQRVRRMGVIDDDAASGFALGDELQPARNAGQFGRAPQSPPPPVPGGDRQTERGKRRSSPETRRAAAGTIRCRVPKTSITRP